MNKQENEQGVITNGTKKRSKKKQESGIERKKKWTRACPNCDAVMEYASRKSRYNSEWLGTWCYSCRNKGENNPFFGKEHTEEFKQAVSDTNRERDYSSVSEALSGVTKSKEHRKKISESLTGRFCGEDSPNYGRIVSKETKMKLRDAALSWWEVYRQTEEYKEWENSKTEYELYRTRVRALTESVDVSGLPNFSKKNLWYNYELDHIFPVSRGFMMGIPEELIADISNLRIIPRKQNRCKGNKIIEELIPLRIRDYLKKENSK